MSTAPGSSGKMDNSLADFISSISASLESESFVNLTLSAYRGAEDLKKLLFRPVVIRGDKLIAITSQYKTKDIHENVDAFAALRLVQQRLGTSFFFARLCTTEAEYELDGSGQRGFRIKQLSSKKTQKISLEHNRAKNRSVPEDRPFLREVGIAGPKGILADKYGKFRQIDKFVELVLPLTHKLPHKTAGQIKIADYGSGKHYLTFALYDALLQEGKLAPEVIGIERRTELVRLGKEAALRLEFQNLRFEAGEIAALERLDADMVVALHACDTATDDALLAGLRAKASAIILAPCCHKYVRPKLNLRSELKRVMNSGIQEERFAALVTDGLRAQVLEAFGYQTRVFEFIDSDHTDRNIMITAVRDGPARTHLSTEQQRELKNLAAYYGLADFYLDTHLAKIGQI
jgi:hypothetical protein